MAKRKSRATRASIQAQSFRDASENLQPLIDEITEELTEDAKAELIKKANEIITAVDFSELESLAEEMRSWSDNMSGTNLECTQKYNDVTESADNLENIEASIDEVKDVEDIEERKDELETKADDLENCEFPTMFS